MVNIAVFAAFAFCVWGTLLSDAEFKGLCGSWQLDMWRYGRQKRQDHGNVVATDGTVGGKNGNVAWRCDGVQVARSTAGDWCGQRVCSFYAVVKVLTMRVGIETVELNYHKEWGVSRREP